MRESLHAIVARRSGVTIVDRFIRYNRPFQGQMMGKVYTGVGYLTGRKLIVDTSTKIAYEGE